MGGILSTFVSTMPSLCPNSLLTIVPTVWRLMEIERAADTTRGLFLRFDYELCAPVYHCVVSLGSFLLSGLHGLVFENGMAPEQIIQVKLDENCKT